jgi:tetratricopeptide (TPR) repeat protein
MAKGEFDQAAVHLEKAVTLDPAFADAWNDLSYARLRQDGYTAHPSSPPAGGTRYDRAVEAARKALELKPGWAHAQYNLGLALLANLQYAEAAGPLSLSAAQQPDRPEPLTALGLAQLGLGQKDQALASCRKAAQVKPDYAPATSCLIELGDGVKRLADTEAAIGQYRYQPGKGFVWTGQPDANGKAEFVRISPPWTCSWQYPDGFRAIFLDCRGDGWTYSWGTMDPGLKTPAGIGVGSPWADVIKAYGASVQDKQAIHYQVADLKLTIIGSQAEGVRTIWFSPVSPYFVINAMMREGIPQ